MGRIDVGFHKMVVLLIRWGRISKVLCGSRSGIWISFTSFATSDGIDAHALFVFCQVIDG